MQYFSMLILALTAILLFDTHQMWEVCFFTDEDEAASIIGNDKIESLQIVVLEEIRT